MTAKDALSDGFRDLVEQYSAVLNAYVRAPSEALRDRAYQLGYHAIASGLGVLDVTVLHQEALLKLLARARKAPEGDHVLKRASELLLESLVPFEMTHRGYKETIYKLVAANEALRRSEARNLALLNALPDVMFRITRDGTFLDFKPGKRGNGDLTVLPDEVIGKSVSAVLPEDLAQQLTDQVERALRSGRIQVFEYHFEVNGQQHDFEARLVTSGQDEVLGIVRDITERKQAEAERERLIRQVAEKEASLQAERQAAVEREALDRLKDQFIAVAAHELKTPVAVMKGYAQMLLRTANTLAPAQRNMLEAIARGSDRIDRIVLDLLHISKLHGGKLKLELEQTDLRALVAEVVDRITLTATKHSIRLAGAEPVIVRGDSDRLGQVVFDLIENAIKYSPQGGEIEVTVGVQDREAVVSVRDRGVGIAEDKQARIFQRFYSAHTGTPYDFGGIAVGLYISREIISRHGGRMWFESQEGKGSTFYFGLPLGT